MLKGSVKGTSFSQVYEIFCPSCGSRYVSQSNLDDSKIICKSCNEVFKYAKKK